MNSWVKMVIIAGIMIMLAGCATFFGKGKSRSYSPEYCYDCHYQPRWDKAFDECGYYQIRVKEAGYEYRVRSDNHGEFIFRTYDIKTARERQQADYEYRQRLKKSN